MNTKRAKAKVRAGAKSVGHAAVEDEMASIRNDAAAAREHLDQWQDRLRDIGRGMRDSANALADQASRQARLRPLVTFGVAMLAGIFLVRALRR